MLHIVDSEDWVLHIVDSEDDDHEGIVGLTALPKTGLRFSHSETENSNSTYVMNRWRYEFWRLCCVPRRTVRKPGVRTSSEICLGGIGVRERCCQSCARDRKKNDNGAIREEHNGVGLQATTSVA